MITTLKDKEVNITWKENQTVQGVVVKSIDLMNDWICIQSLEGDKSLFWARFEDIDAIQVLQQDYDPNGSDTTFGVNGEFPQGLMPGLPPPMPGQGSSFVKMNMEYLLPQASSEFYMATHSSNAFSSIYKIMAMLEEHNDKATKAGNKILTAEIAKIREEAHNILSEFQIDFDEAPEEIVEKKSKSK